MADLILAIIITVLVVYVIIILLLNRFNILQRMNIELIFGFLLMWRTKKGKRLIERLARPKRFWISWGNLSLVIVVISSVCTYALLIWEAVLVISIPPEYAPSPELLIGIPGLNPLIPVGYGIVALAIAIICHEFSHGILTKVANVRLRALGIIAVLVPIGAFVEPDEEQLTNLSKMKRARVFAVGPMSNIVIAFVCALIFSFGFLGSVEPVKDGMVVQAVTVDLAADDAGIEPWMLIIGIDTANISSGKIVSSADFDALMMKTHAGETMNITYYYEGDLHTTTAKLTDKYDYYKGIYPEPKYEKGLQKFKGVGFLGIRTLSLRDDVIEAQAHPFKDANSPAEFFGDGLTYVSLPIFKLSPMPKEISDLIIVKGPLSGLGNQGFWVLANMFYWLFWLNFMVGATNALPARPLDGGHIFKDGLKRMFKGRKGWSKKKIEKMANRWSIVMSLSVLFLILWLMVGPWVSAFLRGLLSG